MRALTLTQPYATLISLGATSIKTLSWATSYRGPLAIYASAGLGPVGGRTGLHRLCGEELFCAALEAAGYHANLMPAWGLPLGAIVAMCELVCCKLITGGRDALGWYGVAGQDWPLTDQESAFGDYAPGRFAWLLTNVRALPEPIPARGAQRLWEWEHDAAIG